MDYVLIKLPNNHREEFSSLWKDLRISEGLDSSFDLAAAAQSENFDGSEFTEWLVPLVSASTPLITALLGYIAAIRGEIEIERKGTRLKMKNMKASQLAEIIKAINDEK